MSNSSLKQLQQEAEASCLAGKLDEAGQLACEALKTQAEDPRILRQMSEIAIRANFSSTAEAILRDRVKHAPDSAQLHDILGVVLHSQNKLKEALLEFKQAFALEPEYAEAAAHAGQTCLAGWNPAEAVKWLERALAICPEQATWMSTLGAVYRDLGRTAEAAACLNRAIRLNPADLNNLLRLAITELPVMFDSGSQIESARQKYSDALDALTQRLNSAPFPTPSLDMVPFHLAYQGRDDLELQRKFAKILSSMAETFAPGFLRRPKLPSREESPAAKLRIGILSGWLAPLHSNWKMPIEGWVKNLDRSRFEVIGYYLGAERPESLEPVSQAFDGRLRCFNGAASLLHIASEVRSDRLHVLIHPEIGMSARSMSLAALRLAPIQCNSWGHPETSGLPSIDYFLSSDLMEPPHAERFYSETLVRLPNLSIHYSPQNHPVPVRTRQAFGLREDAVVYFCAQSLFKYLPQHDDVFVQIAADVPKAQFVFIGHPWSNSLTRSFVSRLDNAMRKSGIEPSGRVVLVPRMTTPDFHSLARACDVFLDSLDWSGCNSAIEAMANGLPLATFPGQFMRGRHTFAFLRMMGLEDLIASSKTTYIALMTRLGTDAPFRAAAIREIRSRLPRLHGDMECIRGLEEFLIKAVAQRRTEELTDS